MTGNVVYYTQNLYINLQNCDGMVSIDTRDTMHFRISFES